MFMYVHCVHDTRAAHASACLHMVILIHMWMNMISPHYTHMNMHFYTHMNMHIYTHINMHPSHSHLYAPAHADALADILYKRVL